jgi:hypothetical protein
MKVKMLVDDSFVNKYFVEPYFSQNSSAWNTYIKDKYLWQIRPLIDLGNGQNELLSETQRLPFCIISIMVICTTIRIYISFRIS